MVVAYISITEGWSSRGEEYRGKGQTGKFQQR